MNKIYLLLIILVIPLSLLSQNNYTYLTAKKLNTIFDTYALKSNQNSQCIYRNEFKIYEFSDSNPFFSDYGGFQGFLENYNICEDDVDMTILDTGKKVTIERPNSLTSKNWQSALLIGASDFMAQRFKDELVNYALNQLLSNLKKDQLEGIQILFPKTISFIQKFLEPNKGKGFYNSDLEMLRYYAKVDLKNISFQIPEFIEKVNPESAKLFNFNMEVISNPEFYDDPMKIFYLLTVLMNSIELSKSTMAGNRKEEGSENLKNQMELVNIYVNALSDNNINMYYKPSWIDYEKVDPRKLHESIEEDNLTVRFYYALLYEQTKTYYNFEDRNNEKYMNEVRDILINASKQAVKDFNNIEAKFKRLNEADNNLKSEDYEKFISSVFKAIDNITSDDYPKFDIIHNSTLELINTVKEDKYQYILPNLFSILIELDIKNVLLDRELLNTLTLMIDFTMVENAEQMKNLLSTYALPIGSSSLKRTGKFDISFNGYVGLSLGYEALEGDLDNTFFNLGLTAPIGVSVSHRYNSKSNQNKTKPFISSGSIFLGIIDIGSLVNNSFDDSVEVQSDFSFKQFIVPSLGYLFNINNSPFSFGVVGSYHLDSRALKDQSLETEQIDSFRLNLSVLVDIPFFTIKHKN